jgi:hypothetical protein
VTRIRQPLYARMLRLRHLAPSGFLCFVFLEGAVALGALLALAELVSWWGVLVLPVTVAAMVKLNDIVAGTLIRPAGRVAGGPATGRSPVDARPAALRPPVDGGDPPVDGSDDRAPGRVRSVDLQGRDGQVSPAPRDADASALNGPPAPRHWGAQPEPLDSRGKRARQSATRRYE